MATKQPTNDTTGQVRLSTVEFEEKNYLKAKAFATANRITFKQLVNLALAEFLKKAA